MSEEQNLPHTKEIYWKGPWWPHPKSGNHCLIDACPNGCYNDYRTLCKYFKKYLQTLLIFKVFNSVWSSPVTSKFPPVSDVLNISHYGWKQITKFITKSSSAPLSCQWVSTLSFPDYKLVHFTWRRSSNSQILVPRVTVSKVLDEFYFGEDTGYKQKPCETVVLQRHWVFIQFSTFFFFTKHAI